MFGSKQHAHQRLWSLAKALIAEVQMREVAAILAQRNIPVAPLKGVLWQRTLYDDPTEREMCDVDVLVPERAFAEAQAALQEADYQPRTSAKIPWERSFRTTGRPYEIDLHCMLFPPGRYRLSTEQLFARATPDETLFGVKVLLLDPYDQLLHLWGHHVCAHQPPRQVEREDFARLVDAHGLSGTEAARRATRAGLGRAARLALLRLTSARTKPFADELLAALPQDAVGAGVVTLADAFLRRCSPDSTGATVAAHSCSRSIPAGALGLARTFWWHRAKSGTE